VSPSATAKSALWRTSACSATGAGGCGNPLAEPRREHADGRSAVAGWPRARNPHFPVLPPMSFPRYLLWICLSHSTSCHPPYARLSRTLSACFTQAGARHDDVRACGTMPPCAAQAAADHGRVLRRFILDLRR